MDVITSVLLAILLLLVFAVYFQRHRSFQYFKERNLSTPPFNFFFGNLLTLWSKRALACQLQEWTKKYGKIYGIFSGCSPIFIVSDVNFLEQVFIKQFSHFASHNTDPYEHATKRSRQGLLMSSGETWRRQKQIVNPIITTSIPKLNPVFNQCIGEVLQSLQTLSLDRNNEIDVYPIYKKAFWDLMCKFLLKGINYRFWLLSSIRPLIWRWHHLGKGGNWWIVIHLRPIFPSDRKCQLLGIESMRNVSLVRYGVPSIERNLQWYWSIHFWSDLFETIKISMGRLCVISTKE